jgi:hypothetical protein
MKGTHLMVSWMLVFPGPRCALIHHRGSEGLERIRSKK